jgi:NAD(P)H dehydrogenase (quinone)
VLTQINISDLGFNLNLEFGYRKRTELEPDLLEATEKIKKSRPYGLDISNVMVWVSCIHKKFYWPYLFTKNTPWTRPRKRTTEKLLKGKTAGIIIAADTSKWYDAPFMKSPAIHQFKKGTLEFCGISPVKVAYISPIKNSKINYKKNWLDKTELLGEKRTPVLQKLYLMILACLKQFLYTFYSWFIYFTV